MRKIKKETFEAFFADKKENTISIVDSRTPVFLQINLPGNNKAISTASVNIQLNGITIDVQNGAVGQ